MTVPPHILYLVETSQAVYERNRDRHDIWEEAGLRETANAVMQAASSLSQPTGEGLLTAARERALALQTADGRRIGDLQSYRFGGWIIIDALLEKMIPDVAYDKAREVCSTASDGRTQQEAMDLIEGAWAAYWAVDTTVPRLGNAGPRFLADVARQLANSQFKRKVGEPKYATESYKQGVRAVVSAIDELIGEEPDV